MESLVQPSDADRQSACKASQRLHDSIANIERDNGEVSRQMHNSRVECQPPPITPRCRVEEIPPDPSVVDKSVNKMIKSEELMQSDISAISPLAANNPQLGKDLQTMNNQLLSLEMETQNLYNLTSGAKYDKDAIVKENRTIQKLTKELEKTQRIVSKDIGCDGNDRRLAGTEQERESVSCDVDAKPKEVWKQIGKFDTLSWHPGIESGTVTQEGSETVRNLISKDNGPKFTETLVERVEDKKSGINHYTYQMTGGLPVQPMATLRVEPHGKGSRITWEADIDTSKVDAATADAVLHGIKGFYQQGLSSLLEKFNKK